MGPKIKRRRLRILDSRFQWRFVATLIFLTMVLSTTLVAIFWYFTDRILTELEMHGMDHLSMVYGAVQNEISRMIVVLGAVVLIFAGAVIFVGVSQSLKVAGPLFALRRSLEALGQRQWDRANVRFRNRDDFQDLESTYNRVVEELRSKQ